jgi:hypothetical protein
MNPDWKPVCTRVSLMQHLAASSGEFKLTSGGCFNVVAVGIAGSGKSTHLNHVLSVHRGSAHMELFAEGSIKEGRPHVTMEVQSACLYPDFSQISGRPMDEVLGMIRVWDTPGFPDRDFDENVAKTRLEAVIRGDLPGIESQNPDDRKAHHVVFYMPIDRTQFSKAAFETTSLGKLFKLVQKLCWGSAAPRRAELGMTVVVTRADEVEGFRAYGPAALVWQHLRTEKPYKDSLTENLLVDLSVRKKALYSGFLGDWDARGKWDPKGRLRLTESDLIKEAEDARAPGVAEMQKNVDGRVAAARAFARLVVAGANVGRQRMEMLLSDAELGPATPGSDAVVGNQNPPVSTTPAASASATAAPSVPPANLVDRAAALRNVSDPSRARPLDVDAELAAGLNFTRDEGRNP